MPKSLSSEEARRVVLAAQGLASSQRSDRQSGWRSIERTIERLNLLQIDSVNVLCRSHYLPLFSRLGPYRRETLDARAFAGRKRKNLFEYWAHEASLLPMRLHPLLRWRMADARSDKGIYKGLVRFAREKRAFVADVLKEVRERGPVTARELSEPGTRTGPWWGWHDGKIAIEYLFWTGDVTAAGRQNNFERVYDIPERVFPADVLAAPTPRRSDAMRELVALSARALGVATQADLRDYFRLPVADMGPAIAELTEAGELAPVEVEGWRMPAWRHRDATLPRRATGTALLSPFDPLVWERDRAERLFGFRYRIEIYTPAPKRTFGYYVLPFVHRGRFAARVCLKADRSGSSLRVNTAHLEEGSPREETSEALARSLAEMAAWLGLETVVVTQRGDLAPALAATLDR